MTEATELAVDLAGWVAHALASAELAPLLPESGLSCDDVVRIIQPRLDQILSVASEESTVLLKTTASLQAASRQRDSLLKSLSTRYRRMQWGLALATVTSWLMLGSGLALAIRWGLRGVPIIHVARWNKLLELSMEVGVGVILSTIVSAVIFISMRTRLRAGRAANERQLDETFQVSQLEAQAKSLHDQFVYVLYRKGILPEVTEIVGDATKPSYETTMPSDATGAGLSEIFTSALEVQTKARRELDDLLRLPGGSIGLAGPRGAGKTTLMNLVANSPVPNGKSLCSVYCSAPVEYPGRDFLVTLFLLLCNRVLLDKKSLEYADDLDDFATPSRDEDRRLAPSWATDLFRANLQLIPILAVSGALLLTWGAWEVALLMKAPLSPAGTTTLTTPQQAGPAATTPQGAASTVAESAPVAQASSAGKNGAAGLSKGLLDVLGIAPGTLLKWGAILLFVPGIALRLPRQRYRSRREELSRRRWQETEGWGPLGTTAKRHLASLRFQQSYTSGWSGALKLPFGLEGGISDAQTLARNQRSLPEVVQDFREFLQLITTEYGRVVIAIDELDKLESDDKAHMFLNEIKAIFGVSRVFYLVSVSENAISAFERRGLPFRDVFDSSFDTIVHVNYLTLTESKRLLKRRTTRIPEPFLCLCHSLSGGLPRDLIRIGRSMLEVAAKESVRDLKTLACQVVARDVRGKARAMSIAASKLPSGLAHTEFMSHLTDLFTASIDDASLLALAEELLERADGLRGNAMSRQDGDSANPSEKVSSLALSDMGTEFGLYLAYVATVLDIVSLAESADDRSAYESDRPAGLNVFDELASIRQGLAVSTAVGRERLQKFRLARGLAKVQVWARLPPIERLGSDTLPEDSEVSVVDDEQGIVDLDNDVS
jgi:hypothetical protein